MGHVLEMLFSFKWLRIDLCEHFKVMECSSSASVRKLPAAAVLKFKRQKRKRGEDCSDSSDFDETPPRSPVTMLVDEEGEIMQVCSGTKNCTLLCVEHFFVSQVSGC